MASTIKIPVLFFPLGTGGSSDPESLESFLGLTLQIISLIFCRVLALNRLPKGTSLTGQAVRPFETWEVQ